MYGTFLLDATRFLEVHFATTRRTALRLINSSTFVSSRIFSENLALIFNKKGLIHLDAPVAIGMTVLCLSKWYMLGLWYDHIVPRLSNPRLAMMDTDSFIFSFDGRSMEEGLSGIRHLLDMSNSPKTHPWHSMERHLTPGFLKEEAGWNFQIKRAVFLRAKQYALELVGRETDETSCIKKSKGITRAAIRTVNFDNYLNALTSYKATQITDRRLQGFDFRMYTHQQTRTFLTGYDDKWQVSDDAYLTA